MGVKFPEVRRRKRFVPRFRREYILGRLDQFLSGAEPAGVGRKVASRLRAAIPSLTFGRG
jgi:hypothetical protein